MNRIDTIAPARTNLLAAFAGERPPAPGWFVEAIAHEPERGFVDVRGAAIETLAWGERGRPGVLFIHGNGANADWWSFIAPFFADEYRVAAFSLSGMGRSAWRDRYSYDGYVDEALEVAETTGLFDAGPPIVVGHSFGAFVTSGIVGRASARLSGAMLVDGPFVKPRPRRPGEQSRRTPRPKRIYDSFAQAMARFRFAPDQDCENLFIADWIARNSLREFIRSDDSIGWTWRFDPYLWQDFRNGRATADLEATRCPLAVIGGSRSGFNKGRSIDDLRPHVGADAPYIVIPDSDHHIMADQPLALVAAIRAQLANWWG